MDIKEVQIACGLDPDFQGVKGAPHGRATGQTTKMLCEAVVAAQTERVLIAGHNCRYSAELQQQARVMCERASVNPLNIIVMEVFNNGLEYSPEIKMNKLRKYDRLFVDHHYERRQQPKQF